MREAAAQLAQHDAVLVPVADGGYVLLGLRADCPEIFRDMAWSTPVVAAETLRRLAALGLSVWLGPTLHDIDEPADRIHLPSEWRICKKIGLSQRRMVAFSYGYRSVLRAGRRLFEDSEPRMNCPVINVG